MAGLSAWRVGLALGLLVALQHLGGVAEAQKKKPCPPGQGLNSDNDCIACGGNAQQITKDGYCKTCTKRKVKDPVSGKCKFCPDGFVKYPQRRTPNAYCVENGQMYTTGNDPQCNGTDIHPAYITCGVGACANSAPRCTDGVQSNCVPYKPTKEVCDGVDNDCDGTVDNNIPDLECGLGACRTKVPACGLYGIPNVCVPPPGRAESSFFCNGIDDNCDGLVDNYNLTCGVGACRRSIFACNGLQLQTCVAGAPTREICNNIDDDCNGMVDDGVLVCDVGICQKTLLLCASMGVPAVCPPLGQGAQPEVCNGRDDNCNGQTDEGLGSITCGRGPCARVLPACNNGVPTTCTPGVTHPLGSPETCDNVDNDCNGIVDDLGTTSCGIGQCARTVQNCVNGQPTACVPGPAVAEICNGLDDNCNGQIDDGTQTCGLGVCRNTVPICDQFFKPFACFQNEAAKRDEVCDGLDNNCDGIVDNVPGATLNCGVGACARSVSACSAGSSTVCVAGTPQREVCNGVDDDCDGTVDNNIPDLECGFGACAVRVPACSGGRPNTCTPDMSRNTTEICDGIDNNCDGRVDEGSQFCSAGLCQGFWPRCRAGRAFRCESLLDVVWPNTFNQKCCPWVCESTTTSNPVQPSNQNYCIYSPRPDNLFDWPFPTVPLYNPYFSCLCQAPGWSPVIGQYVEPGNPNVTLTVNTGCIAPAGPAASPNPSPTPG